MLSYEVSDIFQDNFHKDHVVTIFSNYCHKTSIFEIDIGFVCFRKTDGHYKLFVYPSSFTTWSWNTKHRNDTPQFEITASFSNSNLPHISARLWKKIAQPWKICLCATLKLRLPYFQMKDCESYSTLWYYFAPPWNNNFVSKKCQIFIGHLTNRLFMICFSKLLQRDFF